MLATAKRDESFTGSFALLSAPHHLPRIFKLLKETTLHVVQKGFRVLRSFYEERRTRLRTTRKDCEGTGSVGKLWERLGIRHVFEKK